MALVNLIGLKEIDGQPPRKIQAINQLRESAGFGLSRAWTAVMKLSVGNAVSVEVPWEQVAVLSQRFKVDSSALSNALGTKTGVLGKSQFSSGAEINEHLKMYVLILDDVSPEYAIVAASHAPLICYWRYERDPLMQAWKSGIIFTVICKVDKAAFERSKSEEDHVVVTESKLGGREVAIAFKPRPSWPKCFKFFPLWKP